MRHGVTMVSAATTVPLFLQNTASALAQSASSLTTSQPNVPEDRVLVVVQLGGGNDGLNTVVPFGMRDYYTARPGIGIAERDVLKLGRGSSIGLHPSLTGLKSLYDDGLLSILQGVGYPNPNRSHFKSMDIWHTANTSGVGDGWLGRYFDNDCNGTPEPNVGVAIGRTAPLAMQGRINKPISFESPDQFRWTGGELHEALEQPYESITRSGVQEGVGENTNTAFLMRTALDAQLASEAIRKAVAARPLVAYPNNDLARQLAMVGAMIRAELNTRVYYVTMGGFDTHAGQGGPQGRHAQLLSQFGSALKAFYDDLAAQGNEHRVLTMTFSEFGRRVAQNGSGGTDHGTAAPMFLAGPMVKAGLLGKHPSLSKSALDNGDLRFTLDFRSVQAAILKDWLETDHAQVLGRGHRAARVIRTR